MNIEFLGELAKYHPCIARALELGIISGVLYILLFLTGEGFTWQGLATASLTPIIAALSKYRRDLVTKK